MKLSIYKADNGYVLASYDEEAIQTNAIEFDEQRNEYSRENREKVQEMLYMVLDYFNERGSKHDTYRTVVDVIKRAEDE